MSDDLYHSLQTAWRIARGADANTFGVAIGVVTNAQDPDKLGRVKICFPQLPGNPESDWARVAQPAAGPGRGFYWLPQVNDEVLVAFERGQTNRPYVIGSLWNGQDKPMQDAYSADNAIEMFQTKSGHRVAFHDENGDEKIVISDKSGKRTVTFDVKSKKLVFEAGEGDFEIHAEKKITFECEDLEVKTSKAAKLDVGAGFDLKVDQKAQIKAGPQLNIKAQRVDLNPPSITVASVVGAAVGALAGAAAGAAKGGANGAAAGAAAGASAGPAAGATIPSRDVAGAAAAAGGAPQSSAARASSAAPPAGGSAAASAAAAPEAGGAAPAAASSPAGAPAAAASGSAPGSTSGGSAPPASATAPAAHASSQPKGKKSGAAWVNEFPGSRSVEDLEEPFQSNVKKFIQAIHAADGKVDVHATYRPPERAYLMHWCWMIVNRHQDPQKVEAMEGVDIAWWHGDAESSVKGAQEMVDRFGMHKLKVPPALHSRHTERCAVDMNISWTKSELTIANADGSKVTIDSTPQDETNFDLIVVGKTYGVVHYGAQKIPLVGNEIEKDAPHFSTDGH